MSKRKHHPMILPRGKQLATPLSRHDTKAIAIMALQEALITHHLELVESGSPRARILAGEMNLLNQINRTYCGHVEDNLIEFADRFLCRVQDAMDGFFDSVAESDREMVKRVRGEWDVKEGAQ
jgi:hypothetical protein